MRSTLACLRCKDFIASGDLDYARLELLAMSAALAEVDEITLDDDGARECAALRQQEAKLREALSELAPPSRRWQR